MAPFYTLVQKYALWIVIAIAIFSSLNLLVGSKVFPSQPTNDLRDLYYIPAYMDVYEFAREHYHKRDLWVNASDDFSEFDYVNRRIARWGEMYLTRTELPEGMLDESEFEQLLKRQGEIFATPTLNILLLEPNASSFEPVIMLFADEHTLMLIPFEHLPERIQTTWISN